MCLLVFANKQDIRGALKAIAVRCLLLSPCIVVGGARSAEYS